MNNAAPHDPPSDGALAIEMRASMADIRQLVAEGFERQGQSLALLIGDQKALHSRVSSLETRMSRAESAPSEHDIKTTACLDEEIAERKALTAKVDRLLAVAERFERGWDKVMANPKAKLILAALAYAAYRYLDSHGLPLPSLPGMP